MKYISIHHSAPMKGKWIYCRKGKKYTYEEYCKLIRRQQLIKEIIKEIVLITLVSVVMVFRAYVFLKYGI